jgi:Winged helix-turn helix
MADRFVVRLTEDQQRFLDTLINRGRCSPTTLIRALILRRADVSRTGLFRRDDEIAREFYASASTVYRVRKRFVEHGLQAALFPKDHPRPRRLVEQFAGS